MAEQQLYKAPIWDDIRSLNPIDFNGLDLDIVYGGFPCQDISIAGLGKGLDGKRSGLFFEIIRLAKEINPKFIFLENVPAITTRGGFRVVEEVTEMGYDCRWCVISAASVGALHKRERWFLLAHANSSGCNKEQRRKSLGLQEAYAQSTDSYIKNGGNTDSQPGEQTNTSTKSEQIEGRTRGGFTGQYWPFESREHWQEIVSTICRVSDGIPFHVDQLRALGNSVCPIQAKEAFKILMGLK
jgi:DNA (cytosine-5)-methyltransferase 1